MGYQLLIAAPGILALLFFEFREILMALIWPPRPFKEFSRILLSERTDGK
jgi:hypothetical protein